MGIKNRVQWQLDSSPGISLGVLPVCISWIQTAVLTKTAVYPMFGNVWMYCDQPLTAQNAKKRMMMKKNLLKISICFAMVAVLAIASPTSAEMTESVEHESKWFRFDRFMNYYMMDYLDGDEAHTIGLETLMVYEFWGLEVDHRIYLEVADYPVEIPGKPGNPFPEPGSATGINDLLTGFWAFPENHHGNWKFGGGPVFQFPTASDDSLGAGKWSAGPGFEIAYEKDKWSIGTLGFQLWSFAGDEDRHSVNTLMLKPFLIYKASQKWWLISMPYGVSYYWKKPAGKRLLLPVGGGLQHNFSIGKQDLTFSGQVFKYVERPPGYPEWNVRLVLEWLF